MEKMIEIIQTKDNFSIEELIIREAIKTLGDPFKNLTVKEVAKDLKDSGIDAVLSDNIRRDALQKFAYVSPMAACGLYYHVSAGEAQKTGDARDTFVKLMKEIDALAVAMGVPFQVDIVTTNLQILDTLDPTASTSMQRDIYAGKSSEIDGLIYEVVRMGQQYGVPVPTYEMVAARAKEQGLS